MADVIMCVGINNVFSLDVYMCFNKQYDIITVGDKHIVCSVLHSGSTDIKYSVSADLNIYYKPVYNNYRLFI